MKISFLIALLALLQGIEGRPGRFSSRSRRERRQANDALVPGTNAQLPLPIRDPNLLKTIPSLPSDPSKNLKSPATPSKIPVSPTSSVGLNPDVPPSDPSANALSPVGSVEEGAVVVPVQSGSEQSSMRILTTRWKEHMSIIQQMRLELVKKEEALLKTIEKRALRNLTNIKKFLTKQTKEMDELADDFDIGEDFSIEGDGE